MNLDEYENLNDYLEINEANSLTLLLLKESNNESINETLKKFDAMCDRQWHTSNEPIEKIKDSVEKWLINKWSDDNEFLESALGIMYCYGLSKKLYKKGLEAYSGEFLEEYQNNLRHSPEDTIDPYWSMGKKFEL